MVEKREDVKEERREAWEGVYREEGIENASPQKSEFGPVYTPNEYSDRNISASSNYFTLLLILFVY